MTAGGAASTILEFVQRHFCYPWANLLHEKDSVHFNDVIAFQARDAKVVPTAGAVADRIEAVTNHASLWNIMRTSVKFVVSYIATDGQSGSCEDSRRTSPIDPLPRC
ncbi:hypothetical protein [Qipengyuania sp. 483]